MEEPGVLHNAALNDVEPSLNRDESRVHRTSWSIAQTLVVGPFTDEDAGTEWLAATLIRLREQRIKPCDLDLYWDHAGLWVAITVASTGRAAILKAVRTLVEHGSGAR